MIFLTLSVDGERNKNSKRRAGGGRYFSRLAAFGAERLAADEKVAGVFSSGGTKSIILTVQVVWDYYLGAIGNYFAFDFIYGVSQGCPL